MSETLETQPAKAPYPAAGAAPTFVNFQVLRIDPRYHTLLSNEKVVAKQEFLSCFDTFQRQMKLAAYGLAGLSASGDLLLWRASPDIGAFNQMTGRLQGAGLGKYLTPSRSFLGTTVGGEPGTARFLFLQAGPSSSDASGRGLADEVRRQCALIPAVRLQVIACAGLDEWGHVFALETEEPREYLRLA
ncbi:MAG: chlorite dismutase family protein, partial [Elusimicrobiota bacterium]